MLIKWIIDIEIKIVDQTNIRTIITTTWSKTKSIKILTVKEDNQITAITTTKQNKTTIIKYIEPTQTCSGIVKYQNYRLPSQIIITGAVTCKIKLNS